MMCSGQLGLQPSREFGILNQHGSSGNRENATVPSSSSSGRRLGYGPRWKFSSSKVIDLHPQDHLIQCKVYALAHTGVSIRETQVEPGRFGREGGSVGSGRRADSGIRAERVSRRSSERTLEDKPNIWDANAENVRRRRFSKIPEAEDNDSATSFRQRDGASTGREWDYESEEEEGLQEPQWWRRWVPNGPFNGSYEEDEEDYEEDEEDEEDEESWLSWLNLDLKQVLTLLQWGLPAALLLGSATIASMIGNPLMLLLGFSFFPSAAKFFKNVVRSVSNPFVSPTSNSRSRRSRASNRRTQEPVRSMDYGSPSPGRNYENTGQLRGSNQLGGWEDLVEDRAVVKRQSSSWPPLWKRRPQSKQKMVKREQPLLIRIILAFFPFLRGWGGLL